MNRKKIQNQTTKLSYRLELFYLQAVLPEQNDIIPLPTINNSITLCYNALCSKFRYVQQNSTTFGNTVYKLPLVAWRKAVWHEAALQ
jgi:hypothetical protein